MARQASQRDVSTLTYSQMQKQHLRLHLLCVQCHDGRFRRRHVGRYGGHLLGLKRFLSQLHGELVEPVWAPLGKQVSRGPAQRRLRSVALKWFSMGVFSGDQGGSLGHHRVKLVRRPKDGDTFVDGAHQVPLVRPHEAPHKQMDAPAV